MITKLKKRLRDEWQEVGPFIAAGFLQVLLTALEVLIFVGIPLFAIAAAFVLSVRFLLVCA